MLQVKKLNVRHKKDDRVLLEDFSFVLNPGDKCALIGEEGNGKSTLLKILAEPETVEEYAEYSGEIVMSGEQPGYLPQELSEEAKEQTIYEYLSQSIFFFDLTPKEVAVLGNELGFPAERFYSDEKLSVLSGGEKIKVQMIRLLMDKPTVLLLDEPSNDLDIETLEWLESFLNESVIPVLYISHDETLLERTANKIIHMEQLRKKQKPRYTVVQCGYREYVKNRAAAFEKQETLARKERAEYEKQQEKFRQIQQKVEHQQNVISRGDPHGGRLLKKSMHRIKAYEARFDKEFENMTQLPEYEEAMFTKFGMEASIPNGKTVLDLYLDELKVCDIEKKNLHAGDAEIIEAQERAEIAERQEKEEAPETVLARDIRLTVRGPERICIIGRNGCGKTTLMRLLADELLQRKDIKAAYMPQNYEEFLDLEKTPIAFLSDGSKERDTMMRTYLGSMKFTTEEMMHPIADLSGGQKAKVMLLYLDTSGCDVLLLDEPTRNFSPLSNPVIRNLLKNFKGAIISVSHDRKYIEEVCTKVYRMEEQGLFLVENSLTE